MDNIYFEADELISALTDTIASGDFNAFIVAVEEYGIEIPIETAGAFESWFWGAPSGCAAFLGWYLDNISPDNYSGEPEVRDFVRILEQTVYSYGTPQQFRKFFELYPFEITDPDLPFSQLALKAAKEAPEMFAVMVEKRNELIGDQAEIEQLIKQLNILIDFQKKRYDSIPTGADKDILSSEINRMKHSAELIAI